MPFSFLPINTLEKVSENWAFGEKINKNLSQRWRWFMNVRVPRDQDGDIISGRQHLVCPPWKHSAEDAHGDGRKWTLSSGTTVSADELRPGISCTCLSMTYYKEEQWTPSQPPGAYWWYLPGLEGHQVWKKNVWSRESTPGGSTWPLVYGTEVCVERWQGRTGFQTKP